MHGTEEASNGGRVRVRIIHGLNISHKELAYLLQKDIPFVFDDDCVDAFETLKKHLRSS